MQYAVFIGNLLRGDFGIDPLQGVAMAVVTERLPATLELGLTPSRSRHRGLPVGLLSAVYRNRLIDHVAMGVARWARPRRPSSSGILFILLISVKAGLLPTSGRGDWRHLVLPAVTLGLFAMASIARLTRSAMLEVLRADYIRTARAKGLAERSSSSSTRSGTRPFPSSRSRGSSSAACSPARW